MKTSKNILLLLTATFFSMSILAENSFSVLPVVEYSFDEKGKFSTPEGSAGTFAMEDSPTLGLDIIVENEHLPENLSVGLNFRYRNKSNMSNTTFRSILDDETGELLDANTHAAELQAINAFSQESLDNGSVTKTIREASVGPSLRYGIDINSKVTAYGDVGVHYTYAIFDDTMVMESEKDRHSDEDGSIGYSAGAGISYQVSDQVSLVMGYRYRENGKLEFDTSDEQEAGTSVRFDRLSSHAIMAGIQILW